MAAYDRRTFAGGAVATTITAGINGSATAIAIASTSGWPTGSGGDFGVVIDRGTASEEKVLIASRSGSTLTVATGGRGVDGTVATTHASGASIEVVIFARDVDEPNAHLADDNLDHHSQYLNNARHDVEARHIFGAALGTPVAPASVGTANAAGSGDNPAREDHVHQIGAGAINDAAMFAAGVVDSAIGNNAIGSAELADNAVDTNAIADDAVTAPKVADGAIDAAAKLAADVVTTAKILDANVTPAKLDTTQARTFTVADATARGALTDLREGDTCWQRDTDLRFFYTGAAWRYVPGQKLASAQVTADQTGLGDGPTDLTSLAATFNALGGPVRVFGKTRVLGQTDASYAILRVREGATIIDDVARVTPIGIAESAILVGHSAIITPSNASHTYKLTYVGDAAASGNPTMKAAADEIATIEVWSA